MSSRFSVVGPQGDEEAREPEEKGVMIMSGRGKLPKGGAKGRKKSKQLLARLPGYLRPELKRNYSPVFWDAETVDDPATGASRYSFFTDISQGAGPTGRLGDVIWVDKVVLRFYIEQSSSITFNQINLAALLDSEPAAGSPGWTTAFQGIGAGSIQSYHVAIPNFDSRFRFKYLKREAIDQSATAAYYNAAAFLAVKPVALEWVIPLRRYIRYSNTTARPVEGGELELYGWSSISANTTKVWASYEVFFTDA